MKIKKFNDILNENFFSDLKEKYLINRLKKSYDSFSDYADNVNNNIIKIDLYDLIDKLNTILFNINEIFKIKKMSIEKKIELTTLYYNRCYNALIFYRKKF